MKPRALASVTQRTPRTASKTRGAAGGGHCLQRREDDGRASDIGLDDAVRLGMITLPKNVLPCAVLAHPSAGRARFELPAALLGQGHAYGGPDQSP